MPKFAYSYKVPYHNAWTGEYNSRAEAELAARAHLKPAKDGRGFVMVWTAEIETGQIGDLVDVNRLLLDLGSDSRPCISPSLHDLPDDVSASLKRHLKDAFQNWANEWGLEGDLKYTRFVNPLPGFYTIDYARGREAAGGRGTWGSSDGPVTSEEHYLYLVGRVMRFKRRTTRVDLKGISLDIRIANIEAALDDWDAHFPLPGLCNYERRIREIKDVLRSPWPPGEDTSSFKRYPELQRELRWLKARVTWIYKARRNGAAGPTAAVHNPTATVSTATT
jgi:hypothetical protein